MFLVFGRLIHTNEVIVGVHSGENVESAVHILADSDETHESGFDREARDGLGLEHLGDEGEEFVGVADGLVVAHSRWLSELS